LDYSARYDGFVVALHSVALLPLDMDRQPSPLDQDMYSFIKSITTREIKDLKWLEDLFLAYRGKLIFSFSIISDFGKQMLNLHQIRQGIEEDIWSQIGDKVKQMME
jgi:hypothetical protein